MVDKGCKDLAKKVKENNSGRRARAHPSHALPQRVARALRTRGPEARSCTEEEVALGDNLGAGVEAGVSAMRKSDAEAAAGDLCKVGEVAAAVAAGGLPTSGSDLTMSLVGCLASNLAALGD